MAAISALLMAQLTDTLHEAARAGVSGKQAIETHEWLVDLVSFASLETKLKAEELEQTVLCQDGRGLINKARRFTPAGFLARSDQSVDNEDCNDSRDNADCHSASTRGSRTSYSRFNRLVIISQKPCSSALLWTGPASTPNFSRQFHGLRP